VWAGENRSDVEVELESEDPTEMGDDVISSEEEGGWEVTTLAMHLPAMGVRRRGAAMFPR